MRAVGRSTRARGQAGYSLPLVLAVLVLTSVTVMAVLSFIVATILSGDRLKESAEKARNLDAALDSTVALIRRNANDINYSPPTDLASVCTAKAAATSNLNPLQISPATRNPLVTCVSLDDPPVPTTVRRYELTATINDNGNIMRAKAQITVTDASVTNLPNPPTKRFQVVIDRWVIRPSAEDGL